VVAANRVYPTIDDLAARATGWLEGLAPDDILRLAGLRSLKFDWLTT
jgi:hypothetical protein